jgi:hypothetical protein
VDRFAFRTAVSLSGMLVSTVLQRHDATRIPKFLTDTNDALWMNAKFIPEDVQSCPDILNGGEW